MEKYKSVKTNMASFAALTIALAAAFFSNGVTADKNSLESAAPVSQAPIVTKNETTTAETITATIPAVQTAAAKYKNGIHTAFGTYYVPQGSEQITVSITLQNDVITATEVINSGIRHDSQKYQNRFSKGYRSQVVGKNINEVSLTRVSGASLTPRGFNNALAKIKAEAQA